MTAPLERPAGRPACGARPAGAPTDGRGTGIPSTNPALIRAVLEHLETHTYRATAARFGIAVRQLQRWRSRAASEQAAGLVWPSDADLAYWAERQPIRAQGRARLRSWRRRRALAGGPLFIDSTGTARRLRGLAALGWRYSDVGPLLGVSEERVGYLTRGTSPTVHRDTAVAVAVVYDRLSMTPGPSEVTRSRAAARGWPPPLAWDDDTIDDPAARPHRATRGRVFDEVAVARAMHGDPVHLRPVERAEAVHRLTAQRLPASEIAARLNTTPRSVVRHRTVDTTRRPA